MFRVRASLPGFPSEVFGKNIFKRKQKRKRKKKAVSFRWAMRFGQGFLKKNFLLEKKRLKIVFQKHEVLDLDKTSAVARQRAHRPLLSFFFSFENDSAEIMQL